MSGVTPIGGSFGCAGDPAHRLIGSCPGRAIGAFVFYAWSADHEEPVLAVIASCGHHEQIIAEHCREIALSDGIWIEGDAHTVSEAVLDLTDEPVFTPNIAYGAQTG